jgi:hypothetical protein
MDYPKKILLKIDYNFRINLILVLLEPKVNKTFGGSAKTYSATLRSDRMLLRPQTPAIRVVLIDIFYKTLIYLIINFTLKTKP